MADGIGMPMMTGAMSRPRPVGLMAGLMRGVLLAQFFTNLAGTVGVGLLGTYQSARLADAVKPIITLQTPSPQVAQALSDVANLGSVLTTPALAAQLPFDLLTALRGALESSLQSVFQVGLVLTMIALLVSLLMRGSAVVGVNAEKRKMLA